MSGDPGTEGVTASARAELDERFDREHLDPDVWVPYYLAHWSSRAESAATWSIRDSALHLTIPPHQPLWCPDLHEEPLRVSCTQSASFSGPVGSTTGPQPFRDGLVVQEQQPTLWGYTPQRGRIEVRMRARVDAASMFGFWLAGIEDRPDRSGEILIAEVFGSTVRDGRADVGMGIRAFRDPSLSEGFVTIAMELDTTVDHDYAVDWSEHAVDFEIDEHQVHRVDQSPDYPMQLMIGVFDFPARRQQGAEGFVPELVVSSVIGRRITS
jgi:Glycosyl hydrolases family 16